MFRLSRAFRLRQQFPLYRTPRRPHSQLLYGKKGEPYRYQSVRLQRPSIFTWKRLVTVGLSVGAYYALFHIWDRHIDALLGDLEDDGEVEHVHAEAEVEEQGEGPFYADEDSTFVPMTWARKLPRTFYKGSDPEWQEFIKVAKDKPRTKRIQDELVQVVYTGTQKHPAVARNIGKEAKVGRYWLEITFPDAPPQEYERSGLEIADDYIAWSQQKISAETQWRTARALWPKAMFDGVYATASMLAGIQYRRLKQALGWEGRDPFSPEERFRHAVEMMHKHQHARQGKPVGTQTDPNGTPGNSVVSSPSSATSPAEPTPKLTGHTQGPKLPWPVPSMPMPPKRDLGSTDIPIAITVFSQNLSKSWDPRKAEPPRGCFVVSGLVEVRGQSGRILFDVQSWFDPKLGRHVRVDAAVRGVKRWRQGPKGGI